ncbi:MAG: MFS transporter [Candidatus Micrarchaeia archaeon]|jgi:MFS family permease
MAVRRRNYRQMAILGISAGLYALGSGATWFVLPIVTNKMFDNLFLAAAVIAISNVVSLIFDIPIGELSDKVGRKKLIIAGLALNVLLGFALPHLQSVATLVVFLVALGFANLLLAPPARAFVMEISPSKKTSEFFGIFDTLMDLGFAIGPLAAGYILSERTDLGVSDIGIFTALMCIVALLVILLAHETVLRTKKMFRSIRDVISTDGFYRAGLADFRQLHGAGLAILLSIFTLVFIDGVIWTIGPLYTTTGMSMEDAGLILMMFQLPLLLFQIPAGKLADKYGKITIFVAGSLLAAVSFAMFGLSTDVGLSIALAFCAASGLAFVYPATEGLLTDISTKKQHGGIVGVWGAAEDIAYISSPIIGGLIAQTIGVGATFIFLGLLLLGGLHTMLRLLSERPKNGCALVEK